MTILLLGAGGQLGSALRRTLAGSGALVCATRSGRLPDGGACETADLDRPRTLAALVARTAPRWVVNAAAYTAVDRAESEPDAAFRANAEAPGALALACAEHAATLIHYSTDYVFDGASPRPYREDDATAPLGVYGRSKLAGEEAVRAAGASHAILRIAWIYGPHGRNFLSTMLRAAGEREVLRVVDDQVGSPTPAAFVAAATARILERGPLPGSGTWHLAAAGRTSWHGFAREILDGAAARGLLAHRPRLEAIPTSAYPTPARRPAWSVLDASASRRDFGIEAPHWREALAGVLDAMAAGDAAGGA